MGKENQTDAPKKGARRKVAPARSPEAREQQLINLAVDEAEYQIRNHKASSQIITHYLKLATAKEQLEREKLRHEVELTRAKTETLKSQQSMDEMYKKAIDAMRSYSGQAPMEVEVFDDED